LIVLPGERTKNKLAHMVPLSEPAAAIIKRQPERKGRELVFGTGEGGFSGWSNCKERLDAAITKANEGRAIPHWTLHDLRRTFATFAGGGLPAHLLEKSGAKRLSCAALMANNP
jgi:integrase